MAKNMEAGSARTSTYRLDPIESPSVVDCVINSITGSILRGEIGLGDKLPS